MYRRTNSAGHDYWRQAASLCRAGGGGVSPLCCGWDPAVKRIDWSPGNRGRGAVVSCVLYTGHQWKIDEWICLFYLSWIKPCYIFVTELRMKSLSSSVVLKTRRILIKKKKKIQPKPNKWGKLRQINYRTMPQNREDAPGLQAASGAMLLYYLQSWDKFCACAWPWHRLWIC